MFQTSSLQYVIGFKWQLMLQSYFFFQPDRSLLIANNVDWKKVTLFWKVIFSTMLRWLSFLFSRVLLVQEKLQVFYVWQGHFWVLHSKMLCLNWTHLMTGIKTMMLLENLGIICTYFLICFAELFKSVFYSEREG